ncbi:MAG: CRTAC1 family protein [Moorea sp. SIO4A3]|nr:CRTAC1 family protein [Moorena sp. SIO4A3]
MKITKLIFATCLVSGLQPLLSPSAAFAGLVNASLEQGKTAVDGNVTFSDLAAGDNAGITYRRVPSPRNAIFDALKQQPIYTFEDILTTPWRARGAPGVAILDFDGDHDLDIYVTNGPGANNSLYSNQLQETGQVKFLDLASSAGVAAFNQDSSGVAYGDIDNDSDLDLLVLGTGQPNQLFENQGDGRFIDITETSRIGGGSKYSTSASMGDVNGDGLLDIVIANSFTNWDDQIPLFREPFARNEHNQLFLNTGNNVFVDVSDSSGITNLTGFPEEAAGSASITWAIAMVDYDLDGDLDIVQADDQAAIPNAEQGGFDRGLILLNNDGTGNFTDVTVEANTNQTGAWMGLSFGDLNSDGNMDIFATNLGDYVLNRSVPPGLLTSRWFLGQADGSFTDPGVGELVTTPFGWGTSTTDYDNDGDTDIIFHGALDFGRFVDASNPGVILENDGAGNFTYDANALATSTNHIRRNVQGVAVGDLNHDGFSDIVSVSNFDSPEPIPLQPYSVTYGSPFDETALFVPTFVPTENPGEFVWSGLELPDGTLSVEINSGDNGNGWVEVQGIGTVGLTPDGHVNRDGIGAVFFFTPDNGQTVMQPILGGSSYASQDSLAANFGLGSSLQGTLEVLWPGGVRNRLYNVRNFERLLFPEIPCSFDGYWSNQLEYETCVDTALTDLVNTGVLPRQQVSRFFESAIRAFNESQTVPEPSTILGLGIVLGLGYLSRKHDN